MNAPRSSSSMPIDPDLHLPANDTESEDADYVEPPPKKLKTSRENEQSAVHHQPPPPLSTILKQPLPDTKTPSTKWLHGMSTAAIPEEVEEEEEIESEAETTLGGRDPRRSESDHIYVQVHKYPHTLKSLTAADVVSHVSDELLNRAIQLTSGLQSKTLQIYASELRLRLLALTDAVDLSFVLDQRIKNANKAKIRLRAELLAARSRRFNVAEDRERLSREYKAAELDQKRLEAVDTFSSEINEYRSMASNRGGSVRDACEKVNV